MPHCCSCAVSVTLFLLRCFCYVVSVAPRLHIASNTPVCCVAASAKLRLLRSRCFPTANICGFTENRVVTRYFFKKIPQNLQKPVANHVFFLKSTQKLTNSNLHANSKHATTIGTLTSGTYAPQRLSYYPPKKIQNAQKGMFPYPLQNALKGMFPYPLQNALKGKNTNSCLPVNYTNRSTREKFQHAQHADNIIVSF